MASDKIYEAPQLETLDKKLVNEISSEFREKAKFNINACPELLVRIYRLAMSSESHFGDAKEMAELIELIDSKDEDLNVEQFKLACLFHDIGKSGPPGASVQQQKIMTDYIFNPEFFRKDKINLANVPPRDLSIGHAISLLDLPENKKIEITDYLQTLTLHIFNKETKQIEEQKLDLNKHKMIDLWREHDYWTYQILRPYIENGILNEAIVLVASSHHTLEGHYPITLEIKKFPIKISEIQTSLPKSAVKLELADKYFTKNLQKISVALALVDKYQAWRDRSKKNHKEAIEEIKKEINNSQDEGKINHDHSVFNMFIEAVDLIDKKFQPRE